MAKSRLRELWSRVWHFIWDDDSIWSWIVNVILAFVLIKFLLYPGIGLMLGTSHPVVAVVSGSMEHDGSFDAWWQSSASCGGPCRQEWYATANISQEEFTSFPFKNGFNTGDIMILHGKQLDELAVGDVAVFQSPYKQEPIIHRVVKKYEKGDTLFFDTKGDHNSAQGAYDLQVGGNQLIGVAVFRLPYLGWVKLGFVKLLNIIGIESR